MTGTALPLTWMLMIMWEGRSGFPTMMLARNPRYHAMLPPPSPPSLHLVTPPPLAWERHADGIHPGSPQEKGKEQATKGNHWWNSNGA